MMHSESPCNGICTLGPQGHCVGCGRTGDEVGGWIDMSEAERRDVRKRAEERLRGQARTSCGD